MTIGVLVLGPLLFMACVNGLDVNGLVSKFADYSKIGGDVESGEGCQRIPREIDYLEIWGYKWRLI